MRETGKLLQAYGFEGEEPTWVRVGEGGVATVGRTRVSRVWTGGRQELRFGLAVDVTPVGFWEFCTWRDERAGKPVTPIEKAAGPGVITDFGIPDDVWSLRVESTQQGQHAWQGDIDAIRAELPKRVHACARAALRLAGPDRYLEELLTLSDPGIGAREAMVIPLADRGPSAQLEEAIDNLRMCFARRAGAEYVEEVVIWYARSRAALV